LDVLRLLLQSKVERELLAERVRVRDLLSRGGDGIGERDIGADGEAADG
jgi:hypothetical protein